MASFKVNWWHEHIFLKDQIKCDMCLIGFLSVMFLRAKPNDFATVLSGNVLYFHTTDLN